MKSLKDAVTLYRTLIAEALEEVANHERLENLGRRLDWSAYEWSRKIRPPREAPPVALDFGHFASVPSFLDLYAREVQGHQADVIDRLANRLIVGPTSADVTTALFKPKEDRAKQIFEETSAAWRPLLDKLGEGKVEWGTSEVRTAESMAAAQESIRKVVPTFANFNIDGIEPWQEAMQDSVNQMLRRMAELQETGMRTAVQETFIAGVDPESEWTKVSRSLIEGFESKDVGEDRVGDWILGIPIYDDPDDPTMMRMKTADIYATPNGPKIIETIFGVSDPDGSVEDNPTT